MLRPSLRRDLRTVGRTDERPYGRVGERSDDRTYVRPYGFEQSRRGPSK